MKKSTHDLKKNVRISAVCHRQTINKLCNLKEFSKISEERGPKDFVEATENEQTKRKLLKIEKIKKLPRIEIDECRAKGIAFYKKN